MKIVFKYIYVLFAVGILCSNMAAQDEKRPDWFFKLPKCSNNTFYYLKVSGSGATSEEAKKEAVTYMFWKVALQLGVPVSTEDINKALNSITFVQLGRINFIVPINVVCDYSCPNDNQGGWECWLLCQIAQKEYADGVKFDYSYECHQYTHEDSIKAIHTAADATRRRDSMRYVRKSNAEAIVVSTILPGVGQMIKRHYWEGGLTLFGEIVFLGVGVGTYFGAKRQTKIMNGYNIDYATYQKAQKVKPICQGLSYTCFGLAVILYGINLWRAYTLDERRKDYAFHPAIIPTDNAHYALGLGATIKF